MGDYQLIVQTAPVAVVDTNDALSEATLLGAISTAATTVDASITPDVDVDMYRFTVTAGQVVDFDIDTTLNGPGGLGSYLRLFNGQGQQTGRQQRCGGARRKRGRIRRVPAVHLRTAGTYYLGVSNANNRQYNSAHRRRGHGGRTERDGRLSADRANAPVPRGHQRCPVRGHAVGSHLDDSDHGQFEHYARHRRGHVSLHGHSRPSRRFRHRHGAQRSWRLGLVPPAVQRAGPATGVQQRCDGPRRKRRRIRRLPAVHVRHGGHLLPRRVECEQHAVQLRSPATGTRRAA